MRAYILIMLCISLFELRGQRIAKIAFSNGAGVSIQQNVGTVHFIFGDLVTGYAQSDDKTQVVAGFLTPIFSSGSTPVEESWQGRIKVFPNPFFHKIYLRSIAGWGQVSVSIIDLNGRILWQDKTAEINHEINTDFLHPGIYCLRLQYPDGQFGVYKLIKQ